LNSFANTIDRNALCHVSCSALLSVRWLDPTTYRRPVREVLRREPGLEVALLSGDDDE
jgi:hypothetical protein